MIMAGGFRGGRKVPARSGGAEPDRLPRRTEVAFDGPARRILVMDDNHLIRGMLVRQLRSLGYDVHATVRGEDAVEAYEQAMEMERHFDAVILDLAIEIGWGGGKTLEELRKLDSRVKAIVCSGSLEGPKEHYRRLGFHGVLGKPYTVDDLRAAVEAALKGPGRP